MSAGTQPRIGIVGAGVLGRLLALKFRALNWNVTLFDRLGESGVGSCSYAAGGMLAPYCELETAEPQIFQLGVASLELWPGLLREHGLSTFFQKEGSLVVAHPYDLPDLERFQRVVGSKADARGFRELGASELVSLEPELDRKFMRGLYFPFEGQLDPRGLLASMGEALRKQGVQCRFGEEVQAVRPREVQSAGEVHRFDQVLDCRGLGAKADLPGLRAVRGEVILVEAPEVHLKRPIRLMHPRYPLYIVPRPEGRYFIGATSVETEDLSPISVRSTLELLSAAYTLNAAFAEARVLETSVGLRPAFPDHLPRIQHQPGLARVNGLYRHGYLMSPKIAELVCDLVLNGAPAVEFSELFDMRTV